MKLLWEIDYKEFLITKVSGQFKSVILYLENKDDSNKKIVIELDIKTKNILKTIAIHKFGIKYLHCVDDKIK